MIGPRIDTFGQHAKGSLVGQKTVDDLRNELITPDIAYLRIVELGSAHGWKSAAVRGFVLELAKRVR